MSMPSHPGADRYFRREYRDGWELPAVAGYGSPTALSHEPVQVKEHLQTVRPPSSTKGTNLYRRFIIFH